MDFENSESDPYKILGVPFGASIEVCKATYKSLSKIYHPDVFVGDKSYAQKRMAELNASFEFLDDPIRKRKLDSLGENSRYKEQNQDYDPENKSDEFGQASKILHENWDFACEYHPELLQLYNELRKLNSKSAFFFMAIIVEEKLYEKASEMAEYLEDQFLSSKFGDDPDIKMIAKFAILKKESAFAQDLNRALKVLGESSKDKILIKLASDYPNIGPQALRHVGMGYLIPDANDRKKPESKARSSTRANWAEKQVGKKRDHLSNEEVRRTALIIIAICLLIYLASFADGFFPVAVG